MDRHAGLLGTESEARRFPWTSIHDCFLKPSRHAHGNFKIDIFLSTIIITSQDALPDTTRSASTRTRQSRSPRVSGYEGG